MTMPSEWATKTMQSAAFVKPNLRIIPRLDIKGQNLVKGIHLEGLRVLGKPERFARYYYEQGADELLYVDIVASLYGRNNLLAIIERTAREIFIPLTVGGGLRSIEDIRNALRAGADKVAINTAAVRCPGFLREAAQKFGSSTVVLSIEAIKQPSGNYEAYTDNGRERAGLDVFEWAMRGVELGAGEILVTSVDREGTGLGLAAHGGVGSGASDRLRRRRHRRAREASRNHRQGPSGQHRVHAALQSRAADHPRRQALR